MNIAELGSIFGSHFLDHAKKWGDKQHYSETEILEMVSYWHDLSALHADVGRCEKFVNNTIQNIHYCDNLEFAEKCYAVKLLRDHGFDLLFTNIATFPNNSTELHELIVPMATSFKMIHTLHRAKGVIFHYRTVMQFLVFVFGIIVLPHRLLIESSIFTLAMLSLIFVYEHEHLSHKFVMPKNKLIDCILYTLSILWSDVMRNGGEVHVAQHHRHWKDPLEDEVEYSMNQGKLAHVLRLTDMQRFSIYTNNSDKSSGMLRFESLVPPTFCIILLLLFGIEITFYFWFVPWVIMPFIISFVSQVLQHGMYTNKEDEPDFVFLMPIFGQLGNHISHHKTATRAVWGTLTHDWLKWINPHYYVYLLLFKDSK